ncbi:cytochrome P450 4c3-like isoform X2 [Euwallacea fornicatus]|uniref:cytochrome P450 4c3-like isoform X2 n=2 Tax=Euwallacea fornicatus TaxID=995702 RepID=UPI0033902899
MSLYLFSLSIFAFIYLLIYINWQKITGYIRRHKLLWMLPTAGDYHFLFGHLFIFWRYPPEEIFTRLRPWIRATAPVSVVFTPIVHIINVTEPEVVESLIGKMKNLNKNFLYTFLHRWLGDGLLTSKGPMWQKRRKILTPAFHFSILLQFVDVFNRETKNFNNLIERQYLNQPIDVMPIISDFTLATMSETSMGTKVNLLTKTGLKYKSAIQELGNMIMKRSTTPWLWWQKLFDLSPLRKIEKKDLEVLHNFTTNIIVEKSRNFKTFDDHFDESVTKRKYPLMDILLNAKFRHKGIDDTAIRNEVDTFMFEGHDTVATCLGFTTMLFAVHSDFQREVYQEIVNILGTDLANKPTYANLQEMSLLERCIKESLRLYPPVPVMGRKTNDEISTKFGVIPKDVNVFIHLYDMHRNPDLWLNPDKFDPSRHLPENSQNRHTYAYIPFSAGPRNCIGQRFAMLEIKAFFCGLLRKFVLEPVDTPETLSLIQEIILRSQNGIRVKFTLRQ